MNTAFQDLFRDKIRHVIFDWNGTLLNDAPSMHRAWNYGAAQHRYAELAYEAWRSVHKRPFRSFYDYLRDLAGEPPLSDEEYVAIGRTWNESYAMSSADVELNDGTAELLTLLQQRGITASICSLHENDALEEKIHQLGVRHHFTCVFGRQSHHLHETKTTYLAELFEDLISKCVVSRPDEILMVGDIVDDAVAAHENNMNAALIACGEESGELLRRANTYVFSDIMDLTNALRQCALPQDAG